MSSALLRAKVGEQAIEVVFRPVDDGVMGLGSAPAMFAIKVLILLLAGSGRGACLFGLFCRR